MKIVLFEEPPLGKIMKNYEYKIRYKDEYLGRGKNHKKCQISFLNVTIIKYHAIQSNRQLSNKHIDISL